MKPGVFPVLIVTPPPSSTENHPPLPIGHRHHHHCGKRCACVRTHSWHHVKVWNDQEEIKKKQA